MVDCVEAFATEAAPVKCDQDKKRKRGENVVVGWGLVA